MRKVSYCGDGYWIYIADKDDTTKQGQLRKINVVTGEIVHLAPYNNAASSALMLKW